MKRVLKHQIDIADGEVFYQTDARAFASKNLYNTAQYNIRQSLIYGYKVPSFGIFEQLIKTTSVTKSLYYALPTKVAQLVIKQALDA